jgi:cytosine/adenosine deaminase-related metal-dependent hydrolase
MRLIRGTVIHSIAFGEIQLVDDGGLVYDNNGTIQQIYDFSKQAASPEFLAQFKQVDDFRGKLIIPGFVDAHCHAPQYVFTGTGMDLPLLEWLQKYTFPCEAKFANEDFARFAYEKSIQRHLKCGTTFASYFATIHNSACKILVEVINQVGQRAFVGKVSMDRNSPDFYIEDTQEGGEQAEEFVQFVLQQTETGKKFLEDLEMVSKKVVSPVHVANEECGSPLKKIRTVSGSDAQFQKIDNDVETTIVVKNSAGLPPKVRSVSLDCCDAEDGMVTAVPSWDLSAVSHDSTIAPGIALSPPKRRRDDSCSIIPKKDSTSLAIDTVSHRGSVRRSLLNRSDTPLVMPCVTPRFVPTCTGEIMAKLGSIAQKYALPIQSHLSESVNEIAWVLELHPECETYAGVYERYGLLGKNTYMAHCCHSTKEERETLRKNGTSVVHCASSNFMLSSGIMDVKLFIHEGIKVAIGTDVAGGYSPSMLDAMRQTIIASRAKSFHHREMGKIIPFADHDGNAIPQEMISSSVSEGNSSPSSSSSSSPVLSAPDSLFQPQEQAGSISAPIKDYKSLNYLEAFHLATVGGAEVLGMEKVIGNFLPGKKLDCLIIDVNAPNTPIDTFNNEDNLELFQKFLFLGDDRNITHVYVDGKRVL